MVLYNSHLGSFNISHDNNNLYFENTATGTKKALKVVNNYDFIIKGNKKSISGRGGASGVYDFIVNSIKENLCTSYINKIITDYIMEV